VAVVSGCGPGTAGGLLGADHLAVDMAYAGPLIEMDSGPQKWGENDQWCSIFTY
jgi:hypothetical protein